MKHKRVITRVHTRKLDRGVAKVNLKKAGCRGICKHDKGYKSRFSECWREFAQ